MHTIVKDAGYHENFFGAGRVDVKCCELGAGGEFEDYGFGAIGTLPKGAHLDSRKDFLCGKVFPIRRNNACKVDHYDSPLALLPSLARPTPAGGIKCNDVLASPPGIEPRSDS